MVESKQFNFELNKKNNLERRKGIQDIEGGETVTPNVWKGEQCAPLRTCYYLCSVNFLCLRIKHDGGLCYWYLDRKSQECAKILINTLQCLENT